MKKFSLLFSILFGAFPSMGQRPSGLPVSDDLGNFKVAHPAGMGSEHYVERGTDITYTIHFQNTGTDTAQNLRITDTLSTFLDAMKLREESASHPFTVSLLEGNVVRFSFPNIRLPHSAVSETASRGFVSFTVPQKANLPAKTRITNHAYIHFDFRPAVQTNTVFHTIIENSTGTRQAFLPGLDVDVFPNPVSDHVTWQLAGVSFQHGQLDIFDTKGRLTETVIFQKNPVSIVLSHKFHGHCFYKISLDGQLAATGLFLVK